MSARRLFAAGFMALAALAGCNSLQAAAARDPQKCERDPKCVDRGRAADCDTQCANNPDCTDRCREMNATSGQTEAR